MKHNRDMLYGVLYALSPKQRRRYIEQNLQDVRVDKVIPLHLCTKNEIQLIEDIAQEGRSGETDLECAEILLRIALGVAWSKGWDDCSSHDKVSQEVSARSAEWIEFQRQESLLRQLLSEGR